MPDDENSAAGEAAEDRYYEAPQAEELPSVEGPAVTSAGMTDA